MASPSTMPPSTPRSLAAIDDITLNLRDRILGAVCALGQGLTGAATVVELRERLADVPATELDRVLGLLDREGILVVDRGADRTIVKLAASSSAGDGVSPWIRERVLGAIWSAARAVTAPVNLGDVRARLADMTNADFERTIVSLAIRGEIVLGRGLDGAIVSLATPSFEGTIDFLANGSGGSPNGVARSFFGTPLASFTRSTPSNLHGLTARIAHQLWELRGQCQGGELQNWIDAERIVFRHLKV